MAFGLNRAELIGRLGADVTINHLASGGRVATSHRQRRGLHRQTERRSGGQNRMAPGRDLPTRPG